MGLGHSPLDDLLRRLRRFLHPCLLRVVDAGDGQQVLHNADEPLRVLIGTLEKLAALLRRQGALLLQQHIGRPHDAGQRRADVVGHRPQQVGVHLLPLRLPADGLRLLGPAGDGGRQDGDGHHHQERQRKARKGEADVPERIGEDDVHAEHAHHGHDDTQQIAAGPIGRQKHIQQEHHGHIAGVVVGVEAAQQQTAHHRRQIHRRRQQHVLAGKAQARRFAEPLPFAIRFFAHKFFPLPLSFVWRYYSISSC